MIRYSMNSLENKAKVWCMCIGTSSDRNCEVHCADSVKLWTTLPGLGLHNGYLKNNSTLKWNWMFWFNYV